MRDLAVPGLAPAPESGDRWGAAACLSVAAIALGHGLQQSSGALSPRAFHMLVLTLAMAALAVALPRARFFEKWEDRPTMWILGAGLALQFGQLLSSSPGIYLELHAVRPYLYPIGLVAAAVLVAAGLGEAGWLGRARLPILLALLATHFALGVWLIQASPQPYIDVWHWHNEAFSLLAQGKNPYAATMPDIYGHGHFYGPGLLEENRVLVGFPYPPLSMLWAWAGHAIAGDYRYANLVSMTAAGALMAYARGGRVGAAAAAAFLFTPRGFYVLEQGWTEPNMVLCLALVVFAACRAPRLVPWIAGLFWAVKQYAVLTLPLFWLLRGALGPPRELLKAIGIGAAVAAGLVVPFFAWAPRPFFDDLVMFQARQPFRPDALSIPAWLVSKGQPPPGTWVGFAALAVCLGLSLWRAPRTPAGLAMGAALSMAGFFAFGKQAFCNYYYLIVGALCCAVAATDAPRPEVPRTG